MKFIYIQTICTNIKTEIPFRISIGDGMDLFDFREFLIRPEVVIPKKKYLECGLNRMQLLSAPPFCDLADELLDIFIDASLVFSTHKQFKLLKSQFKIIGYNFNIKPIILWHNSDSNIHHSESVEYAANFINYMRNYYSGKVHKKETEVNTSLKTSDLSRFKMLPGVYSFLNDANEVIYVGKAKNIRKRLQSHFSNSKSFSNIDYSQIQDIDVEYTGNDLIAQLMESASIKKLKPIYNTQQIIDSAPFIIIRGETATGIYNLKITRKDFKDNVSEKYFNKISVKESLETFWQLYDLCRKHVGLEKVKGPCSKVTKFGSPCVCAGTETIAAYNERFNEAYTVFHNKKSRKIYKLKGRNNTEDAFIYTINGIYQGYGFIDKSEVISSENDIVGFLNPQVNNYDTTRIINDINKKVSKDCIFVLDDEIN